jgi:FKBP-type peptidyl-prolyl cis-trans isomerase FkpA
MMSSKHFFYAMMLLMAVTGVSCLKNTGGCSYTVNTKQAPAAEEQTLAAYLTSIGNTTAQKHSSNLYYEITTPGTGNAPDLCSTILIAYSGKLTNGSVFDSQTSASFVLGSLIDGWKLGIPLIKKGGKIRLYIPPSLGYGSTNVKDGSGNVVIPANSILIFDITLTDFR